MNSTESITPAHRVSPEAERPRRLGLWTISAALIAALASWLVGETGLVRVAPRKVPMVTMGTHHEGTTAETERAAVANTAVRTYGLLGAALGFALGTAGGLARGRPGAAASAAVAGALLGTLAGAGIAFVAVPLFERSRGEVQLDLLASMLMHGAIWAAVGASAALALGVGLGVRLPRLGSGLVGGMMGGLVATTAFDMIGAVIFANDNTGEPVSLAPPSRLFALLIVATFSALGGLAAYREVRRKDELSKHC